MASYIQRRKFLATLVAGTAAWPLAARAQQRANGGTTAPTAEAPPFAAAPHSGE
jgi:hypothetical protein